jgi:hypothetical protein
MKAYNLVKGKKLDLTFFNAELHESVYPEKPLKPIFKGFISLFFDLVVGEGVLKTTEEEQTLFSTNRTVLARRRVLLKKGTRLYHLTSNLT